MAAATAIGFGLATHMTNLFFGSLQGAMDASGKLARKMNTPRMADLRNIYNREDVLAAGFETYVGVGR